MKKTVKVKKTYVVTGYMYKEFFGKKPNPNTHVYGFPADDRIPVTITYELPNPKNHGK